MLVVEQGVCIFVCWFGGIPAHIILLMNEGRSCMVVVVSRSSKQSWEIESSITLDVDSSDAPYSVVVPSWTTGGISRVFVFIVFGAFLGRVFFEKRAAEKKSRH
jgi:hypothetical protein